MGDRKLKGQLQRSSQKADHAANAAARVELLLPLQTGHIEYASKHANTPKSLEKRTFKLKQTQLFDAVDIQTQRKVCVCVIVVLVGNIGDKVSVSGLVCICVIVCWWSIFETRLV